MMALQSLQGVNETLDRISVHYGPSLVYFLGFIYIRSSVQGPLFTPDIPWLATQTFAFEMHLVGYLQVSSMDLGVYVRYNIGLWRLQC